MSEPTLYDFEVKNHWTGAVQFTAKIEADPSAPFGVRLGMAVKWAIGADANLAGADLARADLAGAYLAGANLDRAKIKDATVTRVIARVQREIDPHAFIAFEIEGGGLKVMAGCRWFTVEEFRAHAVSEYPDTPKAEETLAILDFIEGRARALGVQGGARASWIACDNCGSESGVSDSPAAAIAAWNTRASAPEMAEALEALIRRMDAFNASDRSQADAYYCLVKGGYAEWEAARAALAKARGR